MTDEKPSISLQEMDQLVDSRFALKEKISEKEKEKTELNKKLSALEGKIVLCLKEHNRRTYATDLGSVYLPKTPIFSVSMPKDPEQKAKLFGWLKEKGIYERYAVVNAASLKALYNAERQAAKERGDDLMCWNIPGLDDAKLYEKLGGKKK